MSNGAAEPLVAVASIDSRSIVGSPGPALVPPVILITHPPTVPLYETQVSVAQAAPIKTGMDAPLESLSSTVAIAFEAKPAANSGVAASATAVRSFLFMTLSQLSNLYSRAARALPIY